MDQRAIFQALEEILLQNERPSERLEALRLDGTLAQVPELLTLPGVQQNPKWHPEGDVWIHTLMVVDEAVRERSGDPYHDRILMWSALCHDLGKPLCTVFIDGRWKSPQHDKAGVAPTRALLGRLLAEADLIEPVCALVLDHLAPHFFAPNPAERNGRASRSAIRKLLARLGPLPLELLVRLGRADSFGRTTEEALRREYPSGEWLMEQAAGLRPWEEDTSPDPIVLGRHLLPLGYTPGPQLGQALKDLYEAQMRGEFDDLEGALAWLKGGGAKGPHP